MIFYRVTTLCTGAEPEPIEKVNLKNKRDVYEELRVARMLGVGDFEGESGVKYFFTKAEALKHHKWLQQQN